MSVCVRVLTRSDQPWHFQWSVFLHADVFLSPWLCLFCSSLTVHSFLLAASSKHTDCSSIYTPTEETLDSAKLCRDFAKGLFFWNLLATWCKTFCSLQPWGRSHICALESQLIHLQFLQTLAPRFTEQSRGSSEDVLPFVSQQHICHL